MAASLPTAYVTSVPGRFAPPSVVDRRSPSTIATSTATNSRNVFLPRAESVSMDFSTPTSQVEELGTNYRVGEYDSLPDSKVTISSYDVGVNNLSLISGKAVDTTTGHTTTFQASDLQSAEVDLVVNYADPNGNVFYSEIMTDLLVEGYGSSLKQKSAAMENFDLVGPNQLGFRGFFITKAYVVQTGDVTSHSFSIASIIGASEAAVPFPTSTVADYWLQRGCLQYVKIERWRSGIGWQLYTETTGSAVAGVSVNTSTSNTLMFATGDLLAGDLFFITYASYKTNVVGMGAIPQTTLDTSDPIAVDTRLTPITINGGLVARGQGLDIKLSLKRDRVEGIGDTSALYGPPQQPDASISLDVKFTGGSIDTLIRTGNTLGTDGGFTSAGDFIDANLETRIMLNTPTPIVAKVYDPRNATNIVKTITSPNAVFKQRSLSMQSKSDVSLKYSGEDQVGNVQVSYTHP